MKRNLSKITIGLLVVICAWYGRNLENWNRGRIVEHDAISYYAYLPAAFIYHDFNFGFLKGVTPDSEIRVWFSQAPNGKPVLRMTMGLAVLWLPFFLAAHLFANLSGVAATGYSVPYLLAIFIAALAYLTIGLVLLRKILLRWFPDWLTSLTLILVVTATNLMHYVISEPGMSHAYSFSLITAFLFVTLRWIERPGIANSLILGLLAGLITLVRPVNGLVILLPALAGIESPAEFRNRIWNNLKYIGLAILMALVVFVPQMVYWKLQTGHILFNSYMESGRFHFLHPHLLKGLFGFRKGWLLYTPVMVIAIGGLFRLHKNARSLRLVLPLLMVLFLYVTYSWWCWWYGGGFGSRPVIDLYGLLAIPLAAGLAWLAERPVWIRITTGVILAAMLFLNQFQMAQYRVSILHWDGMTPAAYRASFLKKNPPEGYEFLLDHPDYQKALEGTE